MDRVNVFLEEHFEQERKFVKAYKIFFLSTLPINIILALYPAYFLASGQYEKYGEKKHLLISLETIYFF